VQVVSLLILTVWEIINTHEFPFSTSSSSSSCSSSHKHMWRLTIGRWETKLEHSWQCVMRRTWCFLRFAEGIINPTLCLAFAQPASINACGGLDVQEWSSRAGPALKDDCLFQPLYLLPFSSHLLTSTRKYCFFFC